MAAAASDVPQLKLKISCGGFPHPLQTPPCEKIAIEIAAFLTSNGVPAEPTLPKGMGAAAGGPELLKAASLLVKSAQALSKTRAAMIRRQVRSSLPQLTIRLESSIEPERNSWNLPTAIQAKNVLAILGELSTFLRREYPLIEFSYVVDAAAEAGSWANVLVADDRLTYSLLSRLIKKTDPKAASQKIWLSVGRHWWCPWGWIDSKKYPWGDAE